MKRELIDKNDSGMAVVDVRKDLFGRYRFTAGVIRTEMRPTMVCRTVGTFNTRREAIDAAAAALSSQGGKTAAPDNVGGVS